MSKFSQKVLQIVNKIPKGQVANYGQVALVAGVPRAAIQVGWVLHQQGDKTPWWRVINSAGRISTTCLEHTASMQKKHLEAEGVAVDKKLNIDIERYRWRPNPEELQDLKLDEEYITMIIDRYGI